MQKLKTSPLRGSEGCVVKNKRNPLTLKLQLI